MPDSASTATMPCIAVMSSSTPPNTGTDAASTPLRPPAAVTGTLLALRFEDDPRWQIAIVRRLKRLNAQQFELGVEVISRYGELITPKQLDPRDSGYSVNGIDIGAKGKGFHALYLPLQVRARYTASPSLMLPAAEFSIGRVLSLVVDGHHQEVCLSAPLERTKDWVWAPFELIP